MDNSKYILKHKEDSLIYIKEVLGDKSFYDFKDVFKLLKSFSFTKEITLEEINDYLPSNLPFPNGMYSFTKGYISDDDIFKIYAVNYGSGFIIIVVSSINGNSVNGYYGNIINDFTLKIFYCLDIICNRFSCS